MNFSLFKQSNCIEVDALDEFEEYLATRGAMDVVWISQTEQDAVFLFVVSILHLGKLSLLRDKNKMILNLRMIYLDSIKKLSKIFMCSFLKSLCCFCDP